MADPECVECKKQKESQKERQLPAGQPCEESYKLVVACMEKFKGNIADCRTEWDEFRKCKESLPKRHR
jgi:hypothetical protein